MDIILLELVLWAGLICFLWVMKDSLGKIESELEKSAVHKTANSVAADAKPARPDGLLEPIGRLGEAVIYRYVLIGGKTYEFDHVSPNGGARLQPGQRLIPPGLVYMECSKDDSGIRDA